MSFSTISRRVLAGAGAVVIVFAVTACGSAKNDSALLTGKVWEATQVSSEQGLVAVTSPGAPTSEFADGKIGGTTGVNRYSGHYTTKSGDKIEIKVGPTTMMAGSPEAMAQEQAFVAALSKATRYSATQTELKLLDDAGGVLVDYKVLKETPLVGTEWDCTMYNNGRGGFQGVISTSTITAVFGDDSSLTGNGGVNRYTGKYASANGTIKIDPTIAATQMAGPPEVMEQEQAYLTALPKATVYKIEGSRLTLRDATGAAIAEYTAK